MIPAWLTPYVTGRIGMWLGGATVVIPPIAAFFALLHDPTYLVVLAHALEHAYLAIRHKGTIPDEEQFALAQLVGAFVGIVGGFVISLLLVRYGYLNTPPPPRPPDAPALPEPAKLKDAA